ncbi:MAG: nitroreductase family deazaflavin-dependent oxidoreductase, partial [Chloroflexota bacterium]
LFLAIHVALYRATNGKIGSRMFGGDVLVLITTGRRTGQRRNTPVMYVRDPEQDRFAVIASNNGSDSHPAWFYNATAAGSAEIQVHDRRMAVGVRQATEEERARLWKVAVANYAGFDAYERKTKRHIPMLLLDPRA